MALDLPTLRKLVALDVNDPLSRFALGRKLAEVAADEHAPELAEAVEHLTFANVHSPGHLATYHILGETLIRLNRRDDARRVLTEGLRRAAEVGEGMGRDLGPAMQRMLETL